MVSSFFGRVKNYIMMPIDDPFELEELQAVPGISKMKIVIVTPQSPEKTCQYADSLQAGITLIIEYSSVDKQIQQTMHDFLDGVCYVISGSCQVLSATAIMYMPASVEVTRNIVAATAPVRQVYPFDRVVPVSRFSSAAQS